MYCSVDVILLVNVSGRITLGTQNPALCGFFFFSPVRLDKHESIPVFR